MWPGATCARWRRTPENLALRQEAGDARILDALAAVDAEEQVALARLVLVAPHTLVLDKATALIDPRAARHLERPLAALWRSWHGDGTPEMDQR